MFSAYVVTPVPPPKPETIVARLSPKKARPKKLSRLLPVIAPMALMWPRFSATRMIATGAINNIASAWKLGPINFGEPIHDAAARAVKSMGFPNPKSFATAHRPQPCRQAQHPGFGLAHARDRRLRQ